MGTSGRAVVLGEGRPAAGVDVWPVVRELPRDWTPIRALRAVGRRPYTLFFESGGDPEAGGEWTFLAFDPLWRLVLRDGELRRVEGARTTVLPGHPLDVLARAWPSRVQYRPAAPAPFTSGLAGYLAYELKNWIERFPQQAAPEIDFPDLSLRYHDVVWAWRRATGEGWVVSTGPPEAEPEERERLAAARLNAQWRTLGDGLSATAAAATPGRAGPGSVPRIQSNFTRASYGRMVERALAHIGAGDIYQVNLAQRFRVEPAPPALEVYAALREAAPAPFLAFASLRDGGIASSSPERFFRLRGRTIETWPIKGTRPRGRTRDEDIELASALRLSEKDRAENVMIVDLERNDLGRVCEVGTVRVPGLCEVSSHSNVHHLVSRVEGRLREDAGPVDVLRALFPGGSITGAPKIRAIEIIDELEPVRRGIYTGALGYWDASGDCDWNIAIRTVVIADGVASFHAGGGIVADSTPEGEYEETLVKARGMMAALGVEAP